MEYLAIVLMFIGMIYQTISLGKPPIMATILAIFVYKEEININRAITLCIIISASIIYIISIFTHSKN